MLSFPAPEILPSRSPLNTKKTQLCSPLLRSCHDPASLLLLPHGPELQPSISVAITLSHPPPPFPGLCPRRSSRPRVSVVVCCGSPVFLSAPLNLSYTVSSWRAETSLQAPEPGTELAFRHMCPSSNRVWPRAGSATLGPSVCRGLPCPPPNRDPNPRDAAFSWRLPYPTQEWPCLSGTLGAQTSSLRGDDVS